jgi:tripartite-type tricarboxylate transporter receptor subunit TctC
MAMTLAFAAPDASAVDYPARPIKLVVPYAAGGPTDVLGRVVADYLGRDLKQTTIVENKPGAQGAIGAEAVARADPDGYTLFRGGRFDHCAKSDALQKAVLRLAKGFSDAGAGH